MNIFNDIYMVMNKCMLVYTNDPRLSKGLYLGVFAFQQFRFCKWTRGLPSCPSCRFHKDFCHHYCWSIIFGLNFEWILCYSSKNVLAMYHCNVHCLYLHSSQFHDFIVFLVLPIVSHHSFHHPISHVVSMELHFNQTNISYYENMKLCLCSLHFFGQKEILKDSL
jgi:hypothetical protein